MSNIYHRFRLAFKAFGIAFNQPRIMQGEFWGLMNSMFSYLQAVAESERPLCSRIAIVHTDTGDVAAELLQLWCGRGDLTPITRCEQLAKELDELQQKYAELFAKSLNQDNL